MGYIPTYQTPTQTRPDLAYYMNPMTSFVIERGLRCVPTACTASAPGPASYKVMQYAPVPDVSSLSPKPVALQF